MLSKSIFKKLLQTLAALGLLFSIFAGTPAPTLAATPEDTSSRALLECRRGSLVWSDLTSYGIRIAREYLQFDWCFNGSSVSVSRTNHWFEISYPNTNVKWKTVNVSDGGYGSKIIFAQGELEFCIGVPY